MPGQRTLQGSTASTRPRHDFLAPTDNGETMIGLNSQESRSSLVFPPLKQPTNRRRSVPGINFDTATPGGTRFLVQPHEVIGFPIIRSNDSKKYVHAVSSYLGWGASSKSRKSSRTVLPRGSDASKQLENHTSAFMMDWAPVTYPHDNVEPNAVRYTPTLFIYQLTGVQNCLSLLSLPLVVRDCDRIHGL